MDLNRGDIVIVAARGPYTTKPRPAVVVQSDAYNPCHDSVTICPLTTMLVDSPNFRVDIAADEETGLQSPSQAMIDKVLTLPRDRLREAGGQVSDRHMARIDGALRHWLDL